MIIRKIGKDNEKEKKKAEEKDRNRHAYESVTCVTP